MTDIQVHMVAQSDNEKTGNVPTIWIGVNKEQARASCDAVKCRFRPWGPEAQAGGIMCYSHGGTPVMALASIARSVAKNGVPSLERQLSKRAYAAKIIRVAAIGDPSVMPWGWWYKLNKLAKKNNLNIISYTQGWRDRPDLAGHTMASCHTYEDAVEARKMGFRPAIATREVGLLDKPITLPDGSKAVVCPHMAMKAKGKIPVTCNDCLLCVHGRSDVGIIFPDHGPTAPSRKGKRS